MKKQQLKYDAFANVCIYYVWIIYDVSLVFAEYKLMMLFVCIVRGPNYNDMPQIQTARMNSHFIVNSKADTKTCKLTSVKNRAIEILYELANSDALYIGTQKGS